MLDQEKIYNRLIIVIIFLVAIILRFSVIFSAHHGDLNNNISWGNIAYENGLKDFYGSSDSDDWPYSAPNQPPLYIITYAGVWSVWDNIGSKLWDWNVNYSIFPSKFIWLWDAKGIDFLFKFPSIVFDLGIGFAIYKYLSSKKIKNAALFCTVWLFNPVSWYNSSIWGQTDAIVNFFGLLAIINLLSKRIMRFTLWFTISFLFKASLLIFIPVIVYIIYLQKYSTFQLIKSALFIITIVLLVSVWFHPKADIFLFVFNLYKNRILPGEIGYLSANAFNFWWILNSGNILDSVKIINIPARLSGLLITITTIMSAILFSTQKKLEDKKIWIMFALSSLIAFLFMTRIHPRYLFPFFPAATIFLAFSPNYFFIYLVLSILHMLNVYYLFWVPDIIWLKNLYSMTGFTDAIAVLFILLLISSFQFIYSNKIKTLSDKL